MSRARKSQSPPAPPRASASGAAGLRRELSQLRRELASRRERDARELARANAQQQAVFNSMVEGVLVLDRHGRIQLVNQSLQRLFSLRVDVRGRTILEAFRLAELAEVTAQEATDFFTFTSRINERFDMPQKLRMVEHMWRVAYADGHLSEHERHVLWRIADLLHVPQGAYVHARMRAQQQAGAA